MLPKGYYPTYIHIYYNIAIVMVAELLDEDSFAKISFDKEKSLMKLEWLQDSKEMNGPHFQGVLYILGGFALQKKSKNIFVDGTKFLFQPTKDMIGIWRTANISPLYNQAGVKKFAFLFPPGYPMPPRNIQNMPYEDFPTGFFTSQNELIKWLDS